MSQQSVHVSKKNLEKLRNFALQRGTNTSRELNRILDGVEEEKTNIILSVPKDLAADDMAQWVQIRIPSIVKAILG